MQFGMHQEVSDCVIAFSGTKAIALKNYCIPKITWQKGSLKLLCHHGPHVSKANTNGNDADVAPEFSPLKTVQFGNPSQDTVDPRDGGFGGRLWRWKWEK